VLLEPDDRSISYSGNWTNAACNANNSLSNVTALFGPGTLTFTFPGSQIQLFGTTQPQGGSASVDLDGYAFEISTDGDSIHCGTEIYSNSSLSHTTHTMTITFALTATDPPFQLSHIEYTSLRKVDRAAIGGGVGGGVATLLILLGLGIWYIRSRRRHIQDVKRVKMDLSGVINRDVETSALPEEGETPGWTGYSTMPSHPAQAHVHGEDHDPEKGEVVTLMHPSAATAMASRGVGLHPPARPQPAASMYLDVEKEEGRPGPVSQVSSSAAADLPTLSHDPGRMPEPFVISNTPDASEPATPAMGAGHAL